MPYPTFCWAWTSCMAYRWERTQHINLLEFIALLNYVRTNVLSSRTHGQRMLHILDSRVTASIVSKGRYSFKHLNRVSRRLTAVLLRSTCTCCPYGLSVVGCRATLAVACLLPRAFMARKREREDQFHRGHLKYVGTRV